MDQYEMEVVQRQPELALVIEFDCDVAELTNVLPSQIGRVYNFAKQNSAKIIGPPFVRHSTLNSLHRSVQAGVPIEAEIDVADQIKVITLPGGSVARTIHLGSHDTLDVAHRTLHSWVRDNDFQLVGGPWEVHLSDPMLEPDASQLKTEILQAVTK